MLKPWQCISLWFPQMNSSWSVIQFMQLLWIRGEGPLVSEVRYHPHKKIQVIRVAFEDQAMYARTSFRGAKTCKIGKKKGVFLVILTNFGKNMMDKLRNKKNACKNENLGSYFHTSKYMFRVCFESPFTRMISSLKYKCPPPPWISTDLPQFALMAWLDLLRGWYPAWNTSAPPPWISTDLPQFALMAWLDLQIISLIKFWKSIFFQVSSQWLPKVTWFLDVTSLRNCF